MLFGTLLVMVLVVSGADALDSNINSTIATTVTTTAAVTTAVTVTTANTTAEPSTTPDTTVEPSTTLATTAEPSTTLATTTTEDPLRIDMLRGSCSIEYTNLYSCPTVFAVIHCRMIFWEKGSRGINHWGISVASNTEFWEKQQKIKWGSFTPVGNGVVYSSDMIASGFYDPDQVACVHISGKRIKCDNYCDVCRGIGCYAPECYKDSLLALVIVCSGICGAMLALFVVGIYFCIKLIKKNKKEEVTTVDKTDDNVSISVDEDEDEKKSSCSSTRPLVIPDPFPDPCPNVKPCDRGMWCM